MAIEMPKGMSVARLIEVLQRLPEGVVVTHVVASHENAKQLVDGRIGFHRIAEISLKFPAVPYPKGFPPVGECDFYEFKTLEGMEHAP